MELQKTLFVHFHSANGNETALVPLVAYRAFQLLRSQSKSSRTLHPQCKQTFRAPCWAVLLFFVIQLFPIHSTLLEPEKHLQQLDLVIIVLVIGIIVLLADGAALREEQYLDRNSQARVQCNDNNEQDL